MKGRILAGLAMISVASTATAQNTQDVTIAVNAISQIAIGGGAKTLTISTAVAGSQPTPASAAATWSVTTNQSNQKLSASIASDFPAGVTVTVTAQAPTANGMSTGPNVLSNTGGAVDLVTGISQLAEADIPLTYSMTTTAAAGVIASTTRTVTYTITAGP